MPNLFLSRRVITVNTSSPQVSLALILPNNGSIGLRGIYTRSAVVVLMGNSRIGMSQEPHWLARWGVLPPYNADDVAAAVRKRWGETSTPMVRRVTLDIKVPRFLVVKRPLVRDEIQSQLLLDFDPISLGLA